MSAIIFKDPSGNNRPFPALIWGEYTLAARVELVPPGDPDPVPGPDPVPDTDPINLPLQPSVSVWIVAEDGSYSTGPMTATITVATSTTGRWEEAKPTGLSAPPAGKKYKIIASLSHPAYPSATAQVTGIQN